MKLYDKIAGGKIHKAFVTDENYKCIHTGCGPMDNSYLVVYNSYYESTPLPDYLFNNYILYIKLTVKEREEYIKIANPPRESGAKFFLTQDKVIPEIIDRINTRFLTDKLIGKI